MVIPRLSWNLSFDVMDLCSGFTPYRAKSLSYIVVDLRSIADVYVANQRAVGRFRAVRLVIHHR